MTRYYRSKKNGVISRESNFPGGAPDRRDADLWEEVVVTPVATMPEVTVSKDAHGRRTYRADAGYGTSVSESGVHDALELAEARAAEFAAIAKRLREERDLVRPHVEALTNLLVRAINEGISLTGTDGALERYLVRRGVRVTTGEED